MAHCCLFGDPLTTNLLFLFILGLHHQTSRWFIITSPFMLRTQEALIAFMGRPPFLVGYSPIFTYVITCLLGYQHLSTHINPISPMGWILQGNGSNVDAGQPTTTQSRRARLSATFSRRQSATKPTSPRRLARTKLRMITSRSLPPPEKSNGCDVMDVITVRGDVLMTFGWPLGL